MRTVEHCQTILTWSAKGAALKGLALGGEVTKVLDFNIGDRDPFEEDSAVFLRHYDPTVDVLTLLEDELNLRLIANEITDIRSRAEAWLKSHASLTEQPATLSIPPRSSAAGPRTLNIRVKQPAKLGN